MLDSAANLLVRWILRDGGKIETTKTQDDLLCNTLASVIGCQTHYVKLFSEIQRNYTLNEWVKI